MCNKVHGWRIGLAKVHHGLYYLPTTSLSIEEETHFKVATIINTQAKDKAIQLHRRVGHLSYLLLKNFYLIFENFHLTN